MKILFVCTGNICRSPTAHWVMEKKLRDAGINASVDSAGTHNYHSGEQADKRSAEIATKRGYDMSKHSARKVTKSDFYDFDLILAMDKSHYANLEQMKPSDATASLALFLEHAGIGALDVADPYYGKEDGFIKTLELIEEAVDKILSKLETPS